MVDDPHPEVRAGIEPDPEAMRVASTLDPVEQIQAQGKIYRNLYERQQPWWVVIMAWIAFLPTVLIFPCELYAMGDLPWLVKLIFGFLGLLIAAPLSLLLIRMTGRRLFGKSPRPGDPDD